MMKLNALFLEVENAYRQLGQYIGCTLVSHREPLSLAATFCCGFAIFLIGTQPQLFAQINIQTRYDIVYNDSRIGMVINAIFTYLEGSFGALIMLASGIGAIVSSAFGQYRAALGLFVVAVGAFVLRSLVGTFFNDHNVA